LGKFTQHQISMQFLKTLDKVIKKFIHYERREGRNSENIFVKFMNINLETLPLNQSIFTFTYLKRTRLQKLYKSKVRTLHVCWGGGGRLENFLEMICQLVFKNFKGQNISNTSLWKALLARPFTV
jgi:hypothetical protein